MRAQGLRTQGVCTQGLRTQGLCAQGLRAQGVCAQGLRVQGVHAGVTRRGNLIGCGVHRGFAGVVCHLLILLNKISCGRDP